MSVARLDAEAERMQLVQSLPGALEGNLMHVQAELPGERYRLALRITAHLFKTLLGRWAPPLHSTDQHFVAGQVGAFSQRLVHPGFRGCVKPHERHLLVCAGNPSGRNWLGAREGGAKNLET